MASHGRISNGTNSSFESFHSASAIPRPISGTSRRETLTHRYKIRMLKPSPSPERTSYSFREVKILPESTEEKEMHDRSRHTSQIPDDQAGSQRMDESNIGEEHNWKRNESFKLVRNLPASQTTPVLSSPKNEITARTLLRPLDPPLPRSRTYTNVTGHDKFLPPKKNPSLISIHLSSNDVVNSRRIEEQREHSIELGTIFVNSTIPKTQEQSSENLNEDVSDDSDPRYVYVSEPTQYWTGRYMALLDVLRTAELQLTLKNGGSFRQNSNAYGKTRYEFDRNERKLKKATIKTLQSFCRTDAALESFDAFERQMYIRDPDNSMFQRGVAALQLKKHETEESDIPPSSRYNTRSPYPDITKPQPTYLGRKVSYGISQNIFRKSSNTVQMTRLTKSMTTSDIVNIQQGQPSLNQQPNFHDGLLHYQRSRRTTQPNVSETRNHAVRERETRGPSRNFNFSRPLETANGVGISTLATRNAMFHNTPLEFSTRSSYEQKLNASSEEELSIVARGKRPEYHFQDEGQTTLRDESKGTYSRGAESKSNISRSVGIECSHSYEGTRKFRKSESMRKFFDSSIREVRKISRRVSNNVGGIDDSF